MEHQRATQSTQKEQSKTSPSSSPHQTSLNHVTVHPLLQLQRTIGNQAVLNLLRSRNAQINTPTHTFREPRFSHDFSQIPIHSPATGAIQTKLAINQTGDHYEQEADRVADRVIATSAYHAVSSALPHIQRFGGQPTGQPEAAPASVDQVLASPGTPLEPALRQDMEQRFGHDFSQVRVHSGAAAEQSAQDVNANAYTAGHNIVFSAGRFAPGTHQGRWLIAHELTHVVQQSDADGIRADLKSNEKPGLPPNAADVGGEGSRTGVITKTNNCVQRTPDVKSGYKLGNEGWSGLVQAAVEELDGDAEGKVLKDILLAAVSHHWLKLWALKLQARLQSPYGNYLHLFFKKLNAYDEHISAEYVKLLAQDGISISPVSGSFQSLDYLDPSVEAPYNPQVTEMKWSGYVDNFDVARYDLSYRPNRYGSLSEKLQVSYSDGTKIDIDLSDISDNIDAAWQNAMSQSYVGPGKRLFPSRLSRNTVPRLWVEKQKALAKMNEYNQDYETFASIALAGVMSNLPIGPVVPLEPPVEVPVGRPGTRTPARNLPPQRVEPESEVPIKPSPPEKPYVNNNLKATTNERQVGALLNSKAQAGELPGVTEVEGVPPTPGKGRSGDYRFTHPDGSKSSADHYGPKVADPKKIAGQIFEKSGQAETAVVELGAGESGQLGVNEAQKMAKDVVSTPGIGINRVIVIKNGAVIVDILR